MDLESVSRVCSAALGIEVGEVVTADSYTSLATMAELKLLQDPEISVVRFTFEGHLVTQIWREDEFAEGTAVTYPGSFFAACSVALDENLIEAKR